MTKVKTRSEINDEYKWDLSLIYKDLNEFNKDFKFVKDNLNELSNSINSMINSASNLYNTLKLDDSLLMILYKLHDYSHLNKDSDTTNTNYLKIYGDTLNLIDEYDVISSKLIPNLLKLKYSKIEEFYLQEPKLKEYEFTLKKVFRSKKHILSSKEEKILSSFNQSQDFPEKIYDIFSNSEIKFDSIKDENNNDVEINDSTFSIYIRSNDRRVRKDAFESLYNGYSNYKETISSMLFNQVKNNNTLTKLRKYNNPLDKALFNENIDTKVYTNLVNTIESNLNVLHNYLDFKEKILGVEKLHLYDIYAPIIKESSNKKYSFDESKKIILDVLKIFGDDYINIVNKAFDEKWIDIYPNKGKISGAYSSGSYLTKPYILLNHQGDLNDVSTLIHEMGHSVHSYYSRTNNTFTNSEYSIFVAEVASTVNELLLNDYLLKNSKDDIEKLNILSKLLELLRTTIYRQTMFSSFEKKIYDLEFEGNTLTSDEMCSIYLDLNNKYHGNNICVDELIQYEWEKVPHFYYNFYVYKYATGLSSAIYIVNNILSGKENAIENYIKFLKSGGTMYPLDELKIADVDLTNKKIIESAIDYFNNTLNEFKELYYKVYNK